MNQNVSYNNSVGFPTGNVTNTARIEYNFDFNRSDNNLWGRGRARVIGAPAILYAGNVMWDTVGWVKSNDPTVWIRMDARPEVIGSGSLSVLTGAGMAPNFGYYNYSASSPNGAAPTSATATPTP